nr:AIPR family protein [uncultured Flavobacterium sp.]
MANINDFKILNKKCNSYFNLLEKEITKDISHLNDQKKRRFGFYLFILESICNVKDINDLVEIITDQEFNGEILGYKDEDLGIDAIYIDDETNTINLFNFKYREKFNPDQKQSLNESFLSTKFTNLIKTESVKGLTGKILDNAKIIIEKLNSSEIWKLKLFIVSNENRELNVESPEISQLRELYDLETVAIGLESITKLMSLRPEPINAIIHIENDSILPFTENSLSSSKSYVIKISANELLRISSNDKSLRENYQIEDYKSLPNVDMEYNLLFDNVRGLIARSKYNENIFSTLRDEPSRFFMYNNGLTMTAKNIISESTNANKKVKIIIEDFQVVNGGQTLRTLHKFNKQDKDNINKYLSKCELLIRIFKSETHSNVRNKIAEYTNSQNKISNIDLKSLSEEQIQIEQYLDEENIIYARKTGDLGISSEKNYTHKISMEKFGQILFALQGHPEKASNQKKQIFDKYYNIIFSQSNFNINKSVEFVKRYFEIKEMYEENDKEYKSSDQKIFYILYLSEHLDNSFKEQIDILEEAIIEFKPESKSDMADSRKLLQSKFKDFLNKRVSISHTDSTI